MATSILQRFPAPPGQGQVTEMEIYGELRTVQEPRLSTKLAGYPEVTVSKDSTRSLTQRENAKSAFLPHDETVSKRVYHAWLDMGVSGALEEIVNSKTDVPDWCVTWTQKLLVLTRWASSLHGSFFPHLALSNEDIVAKFSNVSKWGEGAIKAFAWHPHTLKLACALQDDGVRIHTHDSDIEPLLKHKLQKTVAALAWQPNSSSVLAVACQSCILVWHVEPSSLATRPSSTAAQVLQQQNHTPVTSLAWSPDGRILVSASPVDTAMLAWDVAMETCTPLRRFRGGGVSLLDWSPDGSKVFAATPSNLFRVWETRKWSCEKWTTATGRCKAACWNPTGTTLLFTTENQPIIYSLTFSQNSEAAISGSQTAVACVDVSEIEVTTDDGDSRVKVGGIVHNMVWDPSGERLAVIFQDNQQYITVFRTSCSPVLEITPCGFVKGLDGELPHYIQFQPHYSQGALLTVVWSTGRVGYVMLHYTNNAAPAESRGFQQLHSTPSRTLYSTLS